MYCAAELSGAPAHGLRWHSIALQCHVRGVGFGCCFSLPAQTAGASSRVLSSVTAFACFVWFRVVRSTATAVSSLRNCSDCVAAVYSWVARGGRSALCTFVYHVSVVSRCWEFGCCSGVCVKWCFVVEQGCEATPVLCATAVCLVQWQELRCLFRRHVTHKMYRSDT